MKFYKSWIIKYLSLGTRFPLGLAPGDIEETIEYLDALVIDLSSELAGAECWLSDLLEEENTEGFEEAIAPIRAALAKVGNKRYETRR